jgi:hypothetical protein
MSSSNQDIIQIYNKTFSEILLDYLAVSNALHNNDTIAKLKSQSVITSYDIIELEISLNTLAIQLQTIKDKLANTDEHDDQKHTESIKVTDTVDSVDTSITSSDQEIDSLVNKAIKDIMPLMMLHMMNNDKKSILHANPQGNPIINSFTELIGKASNAYIQGSQTARTVINNTGPGPYDIEINNGDDLD